MVSVRCSGRFLLAICFVLGPIVARAQVPLTLTQAQRLAVERSQQVAALDAAAQAARETAVAAGQLPDPVLKVGVENLPVNGPDRFSLSRDFMTMRRIGLMQELPRSEKRRLKVERVERDIQRIDAERAQAVATVQRETALAWTERHYNQQMLHLLQRQLEETRQQEQGAEIAYRSGRGSQADVFAARTSAISLQDRIGLVERQVRAARLIVARWIGPDAEQLPASGMDWRQSQAAEAVVSRLSELPQLKQLAAQVAAAETDLRQAQANTRSDWTLEMTYAQRGSAYSNMVSVGVSIPLQLDRGNRQDREVAAKGAALAEAEARYRDALASQEAEVRVLLSNWMANKERFARLGGELIPAAMQRTQAALAAYRAGRGDLVGVLAARRDETDARIQLLSLEMETARLWAQLNQLIPDIPATTRKEQP